MKTILYCTDEIAYLSGWSTRAVEDNSGGIFSSSYDITWFNYNLKIVSQAKHPIDSSTDNALKIIRNCGYEPCYFNLRVINSDEPIYKELTSSNQPCGFAVKAQSVRGGTPIEFTSPSLNLELAFWRLALLCVQTVSQPS